MSIFEKAETCQPNRISGLQAGPASVSQDASNRLNKLTKLPNGKPVTHPNQNPTKNKYVCSYTLPYLFLWKLISIYNNPTSPTSTTLPKN